MYKYGIVKALSKELKKLINKKDRQKKMAIIDYKLIQKEDEKANIQG